jgi:hypothetical protein
VSGAPFIVIREGNFSRPVPPVQHRRAGMPRRAPAALSETARRPIVEVKPLQAGNRNSTKKIRFTDGVAAIYKPISGEDRLTAMLSLGLIPEGGGQSLREVAASEVDRALGFDLVPDTVMYNGPDGLGSVQLWVEDAEHAKALSEYYAVDQERMAVLDYFIGNTDRHENNYLTSADGRPVAIDNGLSFPLSAQWPIRSDFVADVLGRRLSGRVLEQVHSVDLRALARRLESLGIGRAAVTGAVARLREVRLEGMITGAAWGGPIVDRFWRIILGGGDLWEWEKELPRLNRELRPGGFL